MAMRRSNRPAMRAAVPMSARTMMAKMTPANRVITTPDRRPVSRERPKRAQCHLQRERNGPQQSGRERKLHIARLLHFVLTHVDAAGRRSVDLLDGLHDGFLARSGVELAACCVDRLLPYLIRHDIE